MNNQKSKLDRNDMRTYPVQKSACKTCPFAGKEPIQLLPENLSKYLNNLLSLDGQHICHTTQANICRGGRDIQLRILCGIGLLNEPTDIAFEQEVEKHCN